MISEVINEWTEARSGDTRINFEIDWLCLHFGSYRFLKKQTAQKKKQERSCLDLILLWLKIADILLYKDL